MAKKNVQLVDQVTAEDAFDDTAALQELDIQPDEPDGMLDTSQYDGETLLFESGPTFNKVEEWRSLYGQVYATEFDDEVYIWRTLKRVEYK